MESIRTSLPRDITIARRQLIPRSLGTVDAVGAGGAAVDEPLSAAVRAVVAAALAWAEHDYGDIGELEADAVLAEAVRDFRRVADERGISLAS